MWDQSYDAGGGGGGGGGFMAGTPGGAEGGGSKKRQRANNIVPVFVSDVAGCVGETLVVEGQETGMLVLVGQVRSANHAETKSVYRLEDRWSGGDQIDCVHWVDEGHDNRKDGVQVDSYVRVIGALRVNQDKKSIMVFKITPLDDALEIDTHELEVKHARLKIRQLKEKENANINGNNAGGGGGGLSNSMMSSGFGGGGGQQYSSGSTSFGNAKQDSVYRMILSCQREEGIDKDELIQGLKGRMGQKEVVDAIDYLSTEGHIYSTIDDDHFKAIEG